MKPDSTRNALCCGCLLLCALLPLPAAAEDLVCVTHQFAPYVAVNDGAASGIEIDVIAELSRRMDLPIEVEVEPWSRALKRVEDGSADCIFSVFRNPERQRFLDYTNVPIHVSRISLYVHRERPILYRGLQDLKGLRVGLVRGFSTSPDFDDARELGWFDVELATEVDQTFAMLARKRVDVVLYNDLVGSYMLQHPGLDEIVELPRPLTANAAYIAFSRLRGHSALIPRFDQAMFSLLADGSYRDIVERHLDSAQ